MPIDTACPHCKKAYRLKDDLAGKSVKCSNAECRKPFPVPARTGPADPLPALIDADALAARLFGEEGDKPAAVVKMIDVTCEACDHKWTEPAEKIGRVVLCPECKHRQKIPEPKVKKADWRDATGGRRLLEKGPELPDDLRDQQMKAADIESLKLAGAIPEPELEPVPVTTYLKWGLLAVGVLVAVSAGVLWVMLSNQRGSEDKLMAEAMKEVEKIDDTKVVKGQAPLMKALLNISAGEYEARLETEKSLKAAVAKFGEAKKELDAQPRSHERDLLYGELAFAVLAMGGDNEQVKAGGKIPWAAASGGGRAPINNTPQKNVQEELRRVLQALNAEGKRADQVYRFYVINKLALELSRRGHADILPEIVKQGVSPEEEPAITAEILLTMLRNGGDAAKLTGQATALGSSLEADKTTNFVTPVAAPALWEKLGVTTFPKMYQLLAATPESLTPATRAVYAIRLVIQDKPAEATEVAKRGAGDEMYFRLRALTAVAELSGDPKPAIEAAAELVAKDGRAIDKSSAYYLYRLAIAAAKAKMPDKADAIAAAIAEEPLKQWAKAECVGHKLSSEANPAWTNVDKPQGTGNTRISHALSALTVARRNGAAVGDVGVTKEFESWGTGDLRGFGYAGLALGLQDRAKK